MDPLKRLEELCKRIGGYWRKDDWGYLCEADDENISDNHEEVAKALAEALESGLKDDVVFRGIMGELIGGMKETYEISADPREKKVVFSAEVASDYGAEYGEFDYEKLEEALEKLNIRKREKVKGREVVAEGDIEESEAAESVFGWGSSSVAFDPKEVKRFSGRDLEEIRTKVIELASDVAEEANEEIPYAEPEEEEGW